MKYAVYGNNQTASSDGTFHAANTLNSYDAWGHELSTATQYQDTTFASQAKAPIQFFAYTDLKY